MQIQKVNSNYNYTNNQKQAFKGRAEQKLFMEIVERPGLLEAAQKAIDTKSGKPFVEYFADAYVALKEAFAQKGFAVIEDSNEKTKSRLFKFTKDIEGAEKEKIEVFYSPSETDCTINYKEQQLLKNEGVIHKRHINYDNIPSEFRESRALDRESRFTIETPCFGDEETITAETSFVDSLDLRTEVFRNTKPLEVSV